MIFPLLTANENELYEIKSNGSSYNEFIADLIDDRVKLLFYFLENKKN